MMTEVIQHVPLPYIIARSVHTGAGSCCHLENLGVKILSCWVPPAQRQSLICEGLHGQKWAMVIHAARESNQFVGLVDHIFSPTQHLKSLNTPWSDRRGSEVGDMGFGRCYAKFSSTSPPSSSAASSTTSSSSSPLSFWTCPLVHFDLIKRTIRNLNVAWNTIVDHC